MWSVSLRSEARAPSWCLLLVCRERVVERDALIFLGCGYDVVRILYFLWGLFSPLKPIVVVKVIRHVLIQPLEVKAWHKI